MRVLLCSVIMMTIHMMMTIQIMMTMQIVDVHDGKTTDADAGWRRGRLILPTHLGVPGQQISVVLDTILFDFISALKHEPAFRLQVK